MAISFTKKTRGSSIIMTEDQAAAIIDNATNNSKIQFVTANPKIKGTATYNRWNNYSSANTVEEYLALNNSREQYGDLFFAIMRGHIKILD